MTTKRLTGWGISLVAATVVTYVLFEFTPVAIPFVEGGVFTIMTIILTALFFSIPIDMALKAGMYDERGWHLGIYDPMGPLAKDDAPPPADYKPIVSRDERMKKAPAKKH